MAFFAFHSPNYLYLRFGKFKKYYTMKKSFLFIVTICLLSTQVWAQSGKVDTMAVSILDRMSEMMGQLGSCSVTVKSNYDVASQHLGLVKHSDEEHVYISGSNKLLVRSEGDKGTHYLSYNGKTLTHYSLEKNHYAQVDAPSSVMEMIDNMNKHYGIVFPVADFLYPAFVDDILAEAGNLVFLGTTKINGKDCFHIAGTAKDKTFQFWIADDPFYLPVKLVIVYTKKEMNPQFEATYCDWQLNPVLPDAIFEFKAPPNAKKITMAPLAVKK
jgi:hypothetical protein